jgi:hypothetical protein
MDKNKLKPIPDYGDLMTIDDFLEAVRHGAFIDYDGHGNYATETQISEKRIKPSYIQKRHHHDCIVYYGLGSATCDCPRQTLDPIDESRVDRRYTHVVWFNK